MYHRGVQRASNAPHLNHGVRRGVGVDFFPLPAFRRKDLFSASMGRGTRNKVVRILRLGEGGTGTDGDIWQCQILIRKGGGGVD